MKTPTFFLVLLLNLNVIATEPTGKIVLKIDGFRNTNGCVHVYLYNSTATKEYPKTKYILTVLKTSIENYCAVITFDNLAYDQYAIQIHHDEDNDNKLRSGFMGIPKEGIGFSNGAKPKLGPPKFHEAKIVLNSNLIETHITVIYL